MIYKNQRQLTSNALLLVRHGLSLNDQTYTPSGNDSDLGCLGLDRVLGLESHRKIRRPLPPGCDGRRNIARRRSGLNDPLKKMWSIYGSYLAKTRQYASSRIARHALVLLGRQIQRVRAAWNGECDARRVAGVGPPCRQRATAITRIGRGHSARHGHRGRQAKALIDEPQHKWIAKLSSSTDLYSVVKAEYIAMRLARMVGLSVAEVKLTRAAGRDVLLVERFDREWTQTGWHRKAMVSALTMLGLDEMMARYASYEDFAEIIRHRFTDPQETLRELFSRLIFNILCGNTDDHARNHAAFWDGSRLTLTPAYDICPQSRAGNETKCATRRS